MGWIRLWGGKLLFFTVFTPSLLILSCQQASQDDLVEKETSVEVEKDTSVDAGKVVIIEQPADCPPPAVQNAMIVSPGSQFLNQPLSKPKTSVPLRNLPTFWTNFKNLMPAPNYYITRKDYGTKYPLDGIALTHGSGNRGPLTWIFNLPESGEYRLFIRRYSGYGSTKVLVDDQTWDEKLPQRLGVNTGATYDWFYLGKSFLESGTHWLDFYQNTVSTTQSSSLRTPNFLPPIPTSPPKEKLKILKVVELDITELKIC